MRTGLLLIAPVLLVAGCASASSRAGGAPEVARRFSAAVAARDGATACALLAASTRDELVQSSGKPCPESLTGEDVAPVGTVRRVEAWGEQAEVAGTSGTVFLSHLTGTWLVVAAGCKPRPGEPYECAVKSG
jgi:hypothetical protein